MSEAGKHSDPEVVRAYFQNFGEHQAPANGSPLYAVLSFAVLDDPELVALAARCPPDQPSANLLFAAVHDRLLAGDDHPLRAWYPDVLDDPSLAREPGAEVAAAFREFALARREALEPVLRRRRVQTNVVRRTTCLIPAFAEVWRRAGEQPLWLIELGCSAGLNLHWDRFGHRYERDGRTVARFGDRSSPLQLSCALRRELPPLPADIPIAGRHGIDLHPIDLDDPVEVRWLRALIFPEHVERHHELDAAIAIARERPARVESGDLRSRAVALTEEVPDDAVPCLYASMVMGQLAPEERRALVDALAEASSARPSWLVSFEGGGEGDAIVRLLEQRAGASQRERLGRASPHGRWLAWGED